MARTRRGTKAEHYLLILRPEPGIDAVRALRAALKVLKRRYGLKVVSVMEEESDQVLRHPVRGLVDVWGKAKCYKSFWVFDLCLHIAMGWEYRDRYVQEGVVVYCAFEGAHGYKKRKEAARRHYNIAEDVHVPLYLMPGQANLIADHAELIATGRSRRSSSSTRSTRACTGRKTKIRI